ncbi:PQQ-binding-like beta-propeller repeat protein [Micromonospora sp. NPDC049900]|uniref:outer membrane protein assembly factor BamB family protein n=1 Tax=Micromonospora sp. NPDC049900 TaxID=3364275 RepID=UPI003793E3A9
MTLIDLGEITEPTDHPPRRHRTFAGSRRWAAALLAVVVLVTMAGAAPPPRRVYATVPVPLGASLLLSADQIFAVIPGTEATGDRPELLAFPHPEPATGTPPKLTPSWRVALSHGHRVFRVQPVAEDGVLVSMSAEETETSQSVLLDARTGRERWREPGVAMFDDPRRALLRTHRESMPNTLRMIELPSARELWSIPLSASSVDYRLRDGAVDAVVVSTLDGGVEVRDPETGKIRHRLPPPADDPAGYQSAWVVGDLVAVVRNSNTVAAYTVDGLVPVWQTTVPTVYHVTDCAALLCAFLASGGVQVLDPATGAIRWDNRDIADLLLVGERRALVLSRWAEGTMELATFDMTTGAALVDHGPWEQVHRYEYAPHLLAVRPVADVGLVLAELHPDADRARPIDVLVGGRGECQARQDLVACRRQDGDFGVWRLPE